MKIAVRIEPKHVLISMKREGTEPTDLYALICRILKEKFAATDIERRDPGPIRRCLGAVADTPLCARLPKTPYGMNKHTVFKALKKAIEGPAKAQGFQIRFVPV